MTCSRCGSQWPMSDCHVCTDGNAGMFGDWQADDVGPEWDDADYNDQVFSAELPYDSEPRKTQ